MSDLELRCLVDTRSRCLGALGSLDTTDENVGERLEEGSSEMSRMGVMISLNHS